MPKLTKRFIDQIEPAKKEFCIFDTAMPGFGLRVLISGRKTFFIKYRAGGRTRRITLGRYGTITPDQARKLAKERLGCVAGGDNPAEEISINRIAPTIANLCDRFSSEYMPDRLKPRTITEYQHSIDRYIKPALGTFKVKDVKRPDIAQLHHTMRDKPYQANRVLGVLSKLFNLCEVWGLREDGSNPTRHVKKYTEKKRERFLSQEEIRNLCAVLDRRLALHEETIFVVAAFKLLLLTGCRLKEIQTLKWSFVDHHHLILPDSKTGARRIPLPQAAIDIIATLPRNDEAPFIIAGAVPGQYCTDLQKPWRRIREEAGLNDVRIHDLRHTYASHAVQNGMDIVMVGKLLGHTQLQTTMRYAHLADAPVRAAADKVSGIINQSMNQVPVQVPDPVPSNVVPLRG